MATIKDVSKETGLSIGTVSTIEDISAKRPGIKLRLQ